VADMHAQYMGCQEEAGVVITLHLGQAATAGISCREYRK
jgi:hypothetical protein